MFNFKKKTMIKVTFVWNGLTFTKTLNNSSISKAYDYVVGKFVGSQIKEIVWL